MLYQVVCYIVYIAWRFVGELVKFVKLVGFVVDFVNLE